MDIDNELSFALHSGKLLRRCNYSWYKITKNSHRHHGLNISSLVLLFKTVVLTKLLYAGPVWLSPKTLPQFKSFYAKACLKISGSTHYTPQGLTLLTMGLEPLEILYKVICTKFALKALSSDANMVGLMLQIEESRAHPYYQHINMVKDYLSLKLNTQYNLGMRRHNSKSLCYVDKSHFMYQKSDIDMLKLELWNQYLISEADSKTQKIMIPENNGSSSTHLVQSINQHKILFPRDSRRSTDTKVMSLLHGHDLTFRSFKHSMNLSDSPYCLTCQGERDDNKHQLLDCPRFNSHYRISLQSL